MSQSHGRDPDRRANAGFGRVGSMGALQNSMVGGALSHCVHINLNLTVNNENPIFTDGLSINVSDLHPTLSQLANSMTGGGHGGGGGSGGGDNGGGGGSGGGGNDRHSHSGVLKRKAAPDSHPRRGNGDDPDGRDQDCNDSSSSNPVDEGVTIRPWPEDPSPNPSATTEGNDWRGDMASQQESSASRASTSSGISITLWKPNKIRKMPSAMSALDLEA